MVQRTVLKVHISCQKCKKKLLQAVSGIEGVDKIEIDEAKETLTVTGDADPYDIIVNTRKAVQFAEVVSVGPPPKPEKDGQKKADEKKAIEKKADEKKPDKKAQDPAQAHTYNPYYWPAYERIPVVQIVRCDEPNPSCSIL